MTAVEGNASVYQVYPASRMTGEGRGEILNAGGPGRRGWAGATQSVRGNYRPLKRTKFDGGGRNASVHHVRSVSRTTGEGRAEVSKGGGGVNTRMGGGGGGFQPL